MELYLTNPDPAQPNQLLITVGLHPPGSPKDPEWQPFCDRVVRELCAYLMARKEEAPGGPPESRVPLLGRKEGARGEALP